MSTQIKKNGNWVTVAGGTRMWVGTKAALQAALDAGELVDGTAVMVTDDYDEGVETGTGTRNATYVKAGDFVATWTKIGHVVISEVQFNLSQATPSIEELITGFPKPVCEVAVIAQGEANDKAYCLVLKKNGAIRTHYNGFANQFYRVTITYLTED